MKKNTGRRINPTSAYIGSGNKTSFFTNRPKSPFSRIKQIYGQELERFETESAIITSKPNKILVQHKKEIKERVRKQIEKNQRQNLIIIVAMVIFVFLLIIFLNYYLLDIIKSYLFKLEVKL